MASKVALIGLDGVPPELMFQRLLDKLPNISKFYHRGLHGNLETCHPPLSIPAWPVMMTGKNPGKLGIYGFRHRRGFSYRDAYVVSSKDVKQPTVWELLSRAGRRSVVLGMAPGYPPKPVQNCNIVSCFLTPPTAKDFTYPPSLKEEVLKVSGGRYLFDATHRVQDRDLVKKELFEMLEQKFDVAEYLVKTKPWDFFIMHEIGFDRLHHAFWKFFDPTHPKYQKGNQYEKIAEEYYEKADSRIGRLVDHFGSECLTFILSDHGSKGMRGAFCINQWLENQGYLRYKTRPQEPTLLENTDIDWSRTKAWGWGGYYARIFFNLKGREDKGIIDPRNFATEKAALIERILAVTDNNGRKMNNLVFEPADLYGTAKGDKPDLMVYFDDLNWRSAGTVGHNSLYLLENDTGPDDSVHTMNGIFLMYNPERNLHGKELEDAKVQDIAPTLLELFGIRSDAYEMDGKVLPEILANAS